MRQGPLYLKSSIFYPSSSWSTLIAKGLKPFVNKYPDSTFTLRLNDEQGDNVRFAFAISENVFERIAKELHQHLQAFLEVHPAHEKKTPCTQSLFIDFPTNSIQYDLFDHIPFLFEYRDKVIDIDAFLAEFWGLVTNTDTPVLERLFENRYVFSVQLFVTLLSCFSKDAEHAHDIIGNVRKPLHDKECLLTAAMEDKYSAQLSDLQRVASETWKMLRAADTNKHVLSLFKKLFNKLAASAKTLKEEQRCLLLYQFIKRLNNDLGILDDMFIIYYVKNLKEFH